MRLLQILTPTKPEFDKTITKILQGSEYKHLKNPISDFLENIKASITEWLLGILKNTFSGVKAVSISNKLSDLFMIIGILVILAIIILIIIKTSNTITGTKRIKEILGEKIDEKTSPNSLRNKAKMKEEEGDFRLAIRFDFIAILLLMHQLNYLYLDETQTNEEIHNYLKTNHFTYLQKFEALINIFNYVWYGHKKPDKNLYENWKDKFEGLWNGVIRL